MRWALPPLLALTACVEGTLYGGGWVSLTVAEQGRVLYQRTWDAPDRTEIRGRVRWDQNFDQQAIAFDPKGRRGGWVQASDRGSKERAEDFGIPCDAWVPQIVFRMGPDYMGQRPWMALDLRGGRTGGVLAAPLSVMTGNLLAGEAHGELIWLRDFAVEWPEDCWVEARPVPVWVQVEWELDPRESAHGPSPHPGVGRPRWPSDIGNEFP